MSSSTYLLNIKSKTVWTSAFKSHCRFMISAAGHFWYWSIKSLLLIGCQWRGHTSKKSCSATACVCVCQTLRVEFSGRPENEFPDKPPERFHFPRWLESSLVMQGLLLLHAVIELRLSTLPSRSVEKGKDETHSQIQVREPIKRIQRALRSRMDRLRRLWHSNTLKSTERSVDHLENLILFSVFLQISLMIWCCCLTLCLKMNNDCTASY